MEGAKSLNIHLLNIQGFTRAKQIEIEELAKREGTIVCLTETQQKIDKIIPSEGLTKIEKMRKITDKKGGGLLATFKKNSWFKMQQVETKSADLLYAILKVYNTTIHLMLVYLSIPNTCDDKERNLKLIEEIGAILEKVEEANGAGLVLGDFNGHTGVLGYQRQNENGQIVMNLMSNYGLTLLNLDEACQGTYTWTRNEQKSVIDFVMANKKCYEYFERLLIDEDREILDISDHNVLTLELKIKTENTNFRKREVVRVKYIKTDQESLEKFAVEMQRRLQTKDAETFEELNKKIEEVSESTLKAVYQRRVNQKHSVTEQPWITVQIREEIKKRKELNRKKRNEENQREKSLIDNAYRDQKRKVKILVKEAITISEKKITNDIRDSKNRSKAMWKNIDKLRRKERREEETQLYDDDKNPLDRIREKEELVRYWTKIYQQHKNEIELEWNTEKQDSYEQTLAQSQSEALPRHLIEHMDMAMYIEPTMGIMEKPEVTVGQVQRHVAKMKDKSAPGPDGLKNELYKALIKTPEGAQTLTRCINTELTKTSKPESWKTSVTKMIPKQTKPTARHLRPIALTDASYKLYMSMVKEEIENHLKINNEVLETQAGFTKGGRVEDNLFLLNHCVEESYKKKKSLFVTAIDFAKAFDSVKRTKLIEMLKKYKVHPNIINSIVEIYREDSTKIKLNKNTEEVINITSGIRQGCTGSTTLFKLITYEIAKELMATRLGFQTRQIYLPLLLFVDDGLMLSQSQREMETMLEILIKASEKCGLTINKEKSAVLVYNSDESAHELKEIGGIPVVEETKYLGVNIVNRKDIFKEHKKTMIKKAQKMANMSLAVICKSCNKLLIGKTFWKSVVLPSILYGANVITLADTEIKSLQTVENGVYRQILGAPRFAPNCSLRGEIGSSLMKTRVVKGHIQYIRNTLQGSNCFRTTMFIQG